MPYNYAHALVGAYAADCADENVKRILTGNEDLFRLGTMGPDPYYGDLMPKPFAKPCAVRFANEQHAMDGASLFGACLRFSTGCLAKQAYTLGYLCHFLLDANAHPYIEAVFPGALHTTAEIRLDLPTTDRYAAAGFVQRPSVFFNAKRADIADELHADLNAALFDADSKGAYRRSLKKWLAVNELTFDPTGRKRRLIRAFPRISAYLIGRDPTNQQDTANLAHRPWGKAGRTESYFELFERARREATALVQQFARAMTDGGAKVLATLKGRNMDASTGV